MRNKLSHIAAVSLILVLTACEGQEAAETVSSSQSKTSSTSAPISDSSASSTGGANVASAAVSAPTPPCKGMIIPVGNNTRIDQGYDMNTASSSFDRIILDQNCTWIASWSDKTWTDGGVAYNSSGTYAFSKTALNDVITFYTPQYPAGIAFNVYIDSRFPSQYLLSIRNPESLYSVFTADNRNNRNVKTGLAFVDFRINKLLGDNMCKLNQANFELCLRNNYNPLTNVNGFTIYFF